MRQADYAIARLCEAVAKNAASSSSSSARSMRRSRGTSRRRRRSGRIIEDDNAFLCGGADANTLTIVTSDNGPWRLWGPYGGSGGPFRGGKFEATEGGLRVFAVFHWPGRILTRKDGACATIRNRGGGSRSGSKNSVSVAIKADGNEKHPIRRGMAATHVEKAGGRMTGVLASLMDLFPTLVHLGRAHLPVRFPSSKKISLPTMSTWKICVSLSLICRFGAIGTFKAY